MDRENADKICTAIFLGYTLTSGQNTFQYEKPEDKLEHEQLQSRLSKLNVEIEVSQSTSVFKTPVIVAKTPKYTKEAIEGSEGLSTTGILLNSLEKAKEATDTYGAYIGGYDDVSKTVLIGPSNLEQYRPEYRSADDKEVKIAYDKCVKATNAAIKSLNESNIKALKNSDVKLDLISPIEEAFQAGHLFKSYHGMVQAIVKYDSSVDSSSLIFEVAYGPNTNKISSCFPCATFMTSNDTPPTSTHLGRGDNWNIPKSCSDNLRKKWEKNITNWYKAGIKKLPIQNVPEDVNKIPAMFLEALTFEGSFMKKIKATIG